MNQTTRTKPAGRRWVYLAVGCVMQVLLGLVYAWSVFISPLEADFGWNRAETALVFSLSLICFCLGNLVGGVLTGRRSHRVVMCLASAIIATGFLLASRISTLAGIYIAYGVLVGLGAGVAYNTLLGTVVGWFPDKKGLCSGVLLMGFGLGGMLLGTLATSLMAAIGWRTMFVVFAVSFTVVLVGGAFILQAAPRITGPAGAVDTGDKTPAQMIRTPRFWFYIVWSLLLSAGGQVVIGHAAAVAGDMGALPAAAALIAGLVSAANGLGRIALGALFDKAGLRTTMLVVSACALLAPLCLLAAFATGQVALLGLGFVFAGFFYGGVPTTNSTFVSSCYGATHFAVNFSLVTLGGVISPVLGAYLAGILRTASGTYVSSFLLMLALCVVGTVSGLQVKRARG